MELNIDTFIRIRAATKGVDHDWLALMFYSEQGKIELNLFPSSSTEPAKLARLAQAINEVFA